MYRSKLGKENQLQKERKKKRKKKSPLTDRLGGAGGRPLFVVSPLPVARPRGCPSSLPPRRRCPLSLSLFPLVSSPSVVPTNFVSNKKNQMQKKLTYGPGDVVSWAFLFLSVPRPSPPPSRRCSSSPRAFVACPSSSPPPGRRRLPPLDRRRLPPPWSSSSAPRSSSSPPRSSSSPPRSLSSPPRSSLSSHIPPSLLPGTTPRAVARGRGSGCWSWSSSCRGRLSCHHPAAPRAGARGSGGGGLGGLSSIVNHCLEFFR
jgi:hypothetical protein